MSRPRMHLAAGTGFAIMWLGTAADAATRAVPGDYPTIAAAIAASANGDVVLVAPGTYNEALNMAGKAITLRAAGAPESTVISGLDLNSRVITCSSGETASTVIDGFTIYGAVAPSGAGVFISNASPVVRRCVFVENYSENFGGAIMVAGASSRPRIELCTFRQNSAFGGGGAIQLAAGSAAVLNNTFLYNSGPGAGVNILAGSHAIVNCRFQLNEGGFANGGAIAVGAGNSVIANCTFIGNHSFFGGGGLWAGNNSSPRIVNCTFTDNNATEGSGVYLADATTAQFANCLLWNNQLGAFAGSVAPNITYSNVQGGVLPGEGNISSQPLYVDADGTDNNLTAVEDNNYRLLPTSPGVDRGNSAALPLDTADIDQDGNTTEVLPVDLDNHRRVVDAEAVNGGPAQPIDMGAYEAHLPCTGDVAPFNEAQFGNDVVNVDDLLMVINSWGQTSQQHQIALTVNAEFLPPVVYAKSGDTIRFSFAIGSHTATSGSNCQPDGRFNQSTSAGGVFVYPVGNAFAGSIPYFCTIHCSMQGVIYVRPFPGDVTHNALVNVDDLLTVINNWGVCP